MSVLAWERPQSVVRLNITAALLLSSFVSQRNCELAQLPAPLKTELVIDNLLFPDYLVLAFCDVSNVSVVYIVFILGED